MAGSLATVLGAGGTIESILGDLLVEYWDARVGVNLAGASNIGSWVGQHRGIVLSAPAAGREPIFEADGSEFGGIPVVQTVLASARVLQNAAISPPLLTIGQAPYVAVVARRRNAGELTSRFFLAEAAAGFASGFVSIVAESGTIAYQTDSSVTLGGPAPDTAVHFIEGVSDDTEIAVDGAVVSRDQEGIMIADVTIFGLGFIQSLDGQQSDLSFAQVIVATPRPSPEQRAALLQLAAETWGIPIAGFAFVVAGTHAVIGDGGQIIGGGS